MSRLSRQLWWTALVAGVAGLLLSLAVIVRGPSSPPPVDEVRGAAALGAPSAVGGGPGPRGPGPTDPQGGQRADRAGGFPRVQTSDASLPRLRPVVRPERLMVPAIGLDLSVRPTGIGRRGQMQLPPDPRILGWYRFGPAPGAGYGSAVLAGHVDSRRYGIGPLAGLAEVQRGDRVRVRSVKGGPTTYRVDSIERFDRQRLPDEVFSRSGPERLRLVTCTGAWLPEAGGYQQNLVVTAVPLGSS